MARRSPGECKHQLTCYENRQTFWSLVVLLSVWRQNVSVENHYSNNSCMTKGSEGKVEWTAVRTEIRTRINPFYEIISSNKIAELCFSSAELLVLSPGWMHTTPSFSWLFQGLGWRFMRCLVGQNAIVQGGKNRLKYGAAPWIYFILATARQTYCNSYGLTESDAASGITLVSSIQTCRHTD